MIKEELWCGYCKGKDFTEIPTPRHPEDSRCSAWECVNCKAMFEDNPGYGYFTVFWGENDEGSLGKYNPNTGKSCGYK